MERENQDFRQDDDARVDELRIQAAQIKVQTEKLGTQADESAAAQPAARGLSSAEAG